MSIQVYEMNEDQIPSDWPRDYVSLSDHLADRAKLLDRIAELEGMVPKWVDFHAMDYVTLCSNGWRSLRVVSGLALMVPPIPLPKGSGE